MSMVSSAPSLSEKALMIKSLICFCLCGNLKGKKTPLNTPHRKREAHEATPANHPSRSQNHLCRSLAVGTGTRTPACPHCPSFCSPGTPSSSIGLSERHRQFRRAQKWLATGRTRRRSPTRRDATPAQQRGLGRGSGARRSVYLRSGAVGRSARRLGDRRNELSEAREKVGRGREAALWNDGSSRELSGGSVSVLRQPPRPHAGGSRTLPPLALDQRSQAVPGGWHSKRDSLSDEM